MHKYMVVVEKIRRKKIHSLRRGNYEPYANLLNRNFHAARPNQKWVTDISYSFNQAGNFLDLSVICDLFDLSIVAYKTSTRQSIKLLLDHGPASDGKEKVTAGCNSTVTKGFNTLPKAIFTPNYTIRHYSRPCQDGQPIRQRHGGKISFPFSNPNAFGLTSRRPSMMHRLIDEYIAFTTMIAFNLTPKLSPIEKRRLFA